MPANRLKQLLRPVYDASLRSIAAQFFGTDQQKRAKRDLHSLIERNPDVSPLNPSLKRMVKEYAREVFGSERYSPSLMVYTAYRGEFVEGWVPEDFYGSNVVPTVNGPYRSIGIGKTMARRVLQSDRLPDKAYFINGSWFAVDGEELPLGRVAEAIFDETETAFVKPEAGYQGMGIEAIRRRSFDEQGFARRGNFVVQRAIAQHEWFDQIFSGAVATLRITTVMPPGGRPSKRASLLRIGRGDAEFVASADCLRLPVVDDDGTLGSFASGPDWTRYRHHPQTGFRFEGQQVPMFSQAVDTCEYLHMKVPQFTIIGWDVAISADEKIEIMEWNVRKPGINFSEAATGPCFADLGWERFA